jgi:hypothetical protein
MYEKYRGGFLHGDMGNYIRVGAITAKGYFLIFLKLFLT